MTISQMLKGWAKAQGNPPFWLVEKDYALSYLLAGIARVDVLHDQLILKGGTALRKMYLVDYRFSEDLDFSTITGEVIPNVDEAMGIAIGEMRRMLNERGPFEVQVQRLLLREPHPGGQDAFTVRVRFPTHREALCRLKVEITNDEAVLLPPEHKTLLHKFPEEVPAKLFCYPIEEIVAEKLRALLQSRIRLRRRGWGASRVCRDYYDLWRLLREMPLRQATLPDLTTQKCRHRGVDFHSPADFFDPALQQVARAEWSRQLCPFVPDCPKVDRVLSELQTDIVSLWERA